MLVTKTTISSTDNKAVTATGVTIKLNADKNNVIDALGLTAGGIKIESVETKGTEKSTTTVNLAANALGTDSANVKLNADKSKEITLKGIKGGQISADLVSEGGKEGKSVKNITLPDPNLIKVEAVIIKIDPDEHKQIILQKPTVRNFKLRMPSQEKAGDYTSILCDLTIDGDVELGDGNFKDMTIGSPFDAFVFSVQDNVPVQVSNLRFEYKDTTTKTAKPEPPKPLTADQETLLKLEEARDAANEKLSKTPQTIGSRKEPMPNPEYDKALTAYLEAQKAYDAQRAKIVGAAKAQAQASMTKKYLDAVEGTATGYMLIFNNKLPLNIETLNGEKYVQISDDLITNLKSVLRSVLKTTVDMPFWSSDDMKAIGEGLKRWYIRFFTAPTAKADIDNIAAGNAFGVISLLLRDIEMWVGKLEDDASMFGLNLNIEGYWALDITSYDSIGIGLCEAKYKHPAKDDYYNLYGFIEYLNYVSPALVSKSGQQDSARMKRLKDGLRRTEEDVNDMGIGDAVLELVAFIKFSLMKEVERLKNTVIENIKGVSITADISLKPQEVINELLKERKAGSLTFDKGKKSIDDVHVEGVYVNDQGVKQTIGSVGAGAKGENNIIIPGATYLSEDKSTKVNYNELEITPVNISYESDVLQVLNKSILLKGLKGAILKK